VVENSSTTEASSPDLGDLQDGGFEIRSIQLGERELTVAVADDPDERARGLMGVDDLGEVDGMLFTWRGEEVNAAFTMRNTLLTLELLVFDQHGTHLETLRMEPCRAEPCPVYQPSTPYTYALEVPAGVVEPGPLRIP
jgi:uncharacterized membrane protein (UPF0127 family)